MAWPIQKEVTIGSHLVSVSAVKKVHDDHSVTVSVTASVNAGSPPMTTAQHTEVWTLPYDNPNYTAAQAQIDFDKHIQKVANVAAGKATADSVTEALS